MRGSRSSLRWRRVVACAVTGLAFVGVTRTLWWRPVLAPYVEWQHELMAGIQSLAGTVDDDAAWRWFRAWYPRQGREDKQDRDSAHATVTAGEPVPDAQLADAERPVWRRALQQALARHAASYSQRVSTIRRLLLIDVGQPLPPARPDSRPAHEPRWVLVNMNRDEEMWHILERIDQRLLGLPWMPLWAGLVFVAWVALVREGLIHRALRIRLVTRDGQPVTRLRAALRAAIPTALVVGLGWLGERLHETGPEGTLWCCLLWAPVQLAAIAMPLLAWLSPEALPHDRLCGVRAERSPSRRPVAFPAARG